MLSCISYIMKLGDYLEQADNGQDVRYSEIVENDPEGAIELLENASINSNYDRIEVSSEYATNKIFDDQSDPLEPIENVISTVLDNQYEAGFNSAHETLRKIRNRYDEDQANDLAQKKADKNDNLTKAADAALGLSGLGFAGSAAIGSIHGMGASTTTGILSAGASARYQGARDRSVTEAVEGLDDAYGHMRVQIT